MDPDPSIQAEAGGVAVGSAAATEPICVGCRLPLTRRGAQGECLRCALRLVMDEPEEDPVSGPREGESDGESVPLPVEVPRYGHFEVARGFDGRPLELGSGAMATTYRALDTVLHAPVALKVISRNVASHPAARARFLREARAAARLHHPNVASVTFYGEEQGECFYAMELVEGETLAERLRRAGVFNPEQAMEIGVQVARALAAAEAVGVVHRDLKPGNLMLVGAADKEEATLHVKVIDWGLAKAVNEQAEPLLGADHTRDGFVGTPAFASPEQFARASERRIDVRSDIYSLGVTLWYLLCGKVPFVGDTLDAIHLGQRALPLEQLRAAKVPGRLAATLQKMVAFDPAQRPQSARELLDVLLLCQQRYTHETPAKTRSRRYRQLVGALALLLVLVVATTWRWQHPRTAAGASGEKPSLAVLPFDNLSPDESNAFFTTGVQDEITNDLAHLAAFNVIGADSTRSYLPGHQDLARIGDELGARYLLEGSVRRQEGQAQINVHLVDLHDPGRPWSKLYTRPLSDLFAVQGEITRAVATHLRATLSEAEKAAIDLPPTSDLAAYDLYLRAQVGSRIFQSAEQDYRYRADTSVPLLEQAVARDPQFALAYAELTDDYIRLGAYEAANGQAEAAATHGLQAQAVLAKAVRLRPNAGEVHLAQARCAYELNGNYEEALHQLDLARQTLPNSAEVESLASFLARDQNHWDEAVRYLERTVQLEPRNADRRFDLAATDRLLRRFDEADHEIAQVIAALPRDESLAYRMFRAIGQLEERADLAPLRAVVAGVIPADKPSPEIMVKARLVIALYSHDGAAATALLADIPPTGLMWGENRLPKGWFEALAARLRHDEAGARAAFARARLEEERVVAAAPLDGYALSVLAMIDAGLGDKDKAVGEARHLSDPDPVAQSPTGASVVQSAAMSPTVACHVAVVYAWTSQPDLACKTLEPLVHQPAGAGLVKQPNYGDFALNPVWDPLQGNPRFDALVARLAPGAKQVTPAEPGPKP